MQGGKLRQKAVLADVGVLGPVRADGVAVVCPWRHRVQVQVLPAGEPDGVPVGVDGAAGQPDVVAAGELAQAGADQQVAALGPARQVPDGAAISPSRSPRVWMGMPRMRRASRRIGAPRDSR